jgi:alpha-L-fucosidase
LLSELRLIWFDGEGLITEAQAFRFYKMIYDLNPSIIINRRVGYDFGDYVDAGDHKTPTESELAAKHFETCGTANHAWGFKAHNHNWRSSNELLRKFVDIVSKGGSYLLNIGPDGKGRVPEPCVKSFLDMGTWVRTNSDAIFGTASFRRIVGAMPRQRCAGCERMPSGWGSTRIVSRSVVARPVGIWRQRSRWFRGLRKAIIGR